MTSITGSYNTYITVRTEYEGFHYYPNAGKIDPRIQFLENEHRHLFKVAATLEVFHDDRELEFFLVKWDLNEFIKGGNMNHKSCEMMSREILEHLQNKWGLHRWISVTVSEDGESDGTITWSPKGYQNV